MSKLFGENERMVITNEELLQERYTTEDIDNLSDEMDRLVIVQNEALVVLADLMAEDALSGQVSTESKADVISTEEGISTYNESCIRLGAESMMVDDMGITLEALEGKRKGLIAATYKQLDNIVKSLFDIKEQLMAMVNTVHKIKTAKLDSIISGLKGGDLKMKKELSSAEKTSINKKLAIYASFGNKDINVDKLIEFFDIPYDVIVKNSLLTDSMSYAIDNLIVGKPLEKDIPVNKASLKYLDMHENKTVRNWLNKDTRAGIQDRYLGNVFTILAITQSEDYGASVTNHYFKVPVSDLKSGVYSEKDLLKLLDYGSGMGATGQEIGSEMKELLLMDVIKILRSSFATSLFAALFRIFAIRRLIRQYFLVTTYYSGMQQTAMMLKRNHMKTIDFIYELANNMTESK